MCNTKTTIEKEQQALGFVEGVALSVGSTGYKYKDRDDLLFMSLAPDTNVAGVFTKSLCPSAPVEYCRKILPFGKARALVVNAGNANAFTGSAGKIAVQQIAQATANILNCDPNQVFLASTGVIGEPLEAEPIINLLSSLANKTTTDNWQKAAKSIMTTDLFAKYGSRVFTYNGAEITINAIAKGAGMIAPNMATMLCFAATNAAISSEILQKILQRAVDNSFNIITVDSDTSTSDSVILFATGFADNNPIYDFIDPMVEVFQSQLNSLFKELALQIVSDGEGASHLIKIEIAGACSDQSARKIALSIANSPLVKTSIAGNDANWGRVIMAIGKAGEPAYRDKLAIYFGSNCVAREGERDPNYDEELLSEYMNNYQIDIKVNMNIGDGKAEIWTCDLTSEYVAINANYRS